MSMSLPATDDQMLISLRELKLRPGMFLQIQCGSGAGPIVETKFCAAIEGKGVMVVLLGAASFKDGQLQRVRGFTGLFDFGFESAAIQSFTYPFAYTLLAYPEQVRARRVRSSVRIRTSIPAQVEGPSGESRGIIIDLCTAGAMLRSIAPQGPIGSKVLLTFTVEGTHEPHPLKLEGVVCHTSKFESGDGYRTGFSFEGIARRDRLVLQNFTLAHQLDDGVLTSG
jgi:hypothetical protein